MKKILGLDIGVSSVGLAIVNEADDGQKSIKNLAVRIVPEDPNFHGKFYSGNTASKNLERTTKRGIRRNNQRFKQRRDKLSRILKEHDMYPEQYLIHTDIYTLYDLRSKAVTEKISLKELGRVFLLINQRRGFLSNRKSSSPDENKSEYKQKIAELENRRDNDTIGQSLFKELIGVDHPQKILLRERTYLRSSYLEEFDRIWDEQSTHYPNILNGGPQTDYNKNTLYDLIRNKTIFYQRPLKSQKGLVSKCPYEQHHRASHKSSPYFEYFRIWQKLNDLNWKDYNGTLSFPSDEQKNQLFQALWFGDKLNSKQVLTVSKIKEIVGFKKSDKIYFNFPELDGAKTYSKLAAAMKKARVPDYKKLLVFDLEGHDTKGGLFELWHLTYSIGNPDHLKNALVNRFGFAQEQAKVITENVGYTSDYGRLSTRAIRKLLPYMVKGMQYSDACDAIGYDHSGHKTEIKLKEKLDLLSQNSLRNPVVEQVLNQVVNMVNLAIDRYGQFDEIRVELARELRNSAKTRSRISQLNSKNKRKSDEIRKILKEEYGRKIVNGRDIKRYKLWKETNHICLYCNNHIKVSELLNGQADIDHILPKSRSFNNAMSNYILSHRKCNSDKKQQTALDFMSSSDDKLSRYIEQVNELYDKGQISKKKFDNLMCAGADIPADFVERMKKDSQYIAVEAVQMLKTICPNVHTTTGQVTDLLRSEWGLKHVLQELMLPKYGAIGQTEWRKIKTNQGTTKKIEDIRDWSKRDDHRHHAVDALITALTDQKIIFKLNNLNKIFQNEKAALSKDELEKLEESLKGKFNLKQFFDDSTHVFDLPIKNLRSEVKKHLEDVFISFKKSNSKVLTPNTNKATGKTCWTPRGRLHEETVMGKVKRVADKKQKLNAKFRDPELIVNPEIRSIVINHLCNHGDNPKIAFSSKALKKDPIRYQNKHITEVIVYEELLSKRVLINENITKAQVAKVIDSKAKELIENRISQYGSIKKAFKDIEEEPLWFNKEKGIKLKSVKVYDSSKVLPIHHSNGKQRDFVKTGNNHHALVYLDKQGKYHEKVITFWDAVGIGLTNIELTSKPYPIINRDNDPELGDFQFSLQINDLFVIDLKHSQHPAEENELDFFDPKNRKEISDRLFRLQKLSKNSAGQFQIDWRHHLETSVSRTQSELRGIAWERFQSNGNLSRLTKVRINHLGEIIKVGE